MATRRELLPGLPVSALMAVCPLLAASILVYREGKAAGVAELLKRSLDFGRTERKVWYFPVLLLMPGLAVLAYGLMRVARLPVPAPRFPGLAALVLLLAFFASGLAEELGWSGYAIDPLQRRWGALRAAVLLGAVWAAWHVVPLLQAHRSAAWIAWWCLYTVALRVLTVWLYDNAGRSVFAAALFHATQNVSWQLFPNRGSHYDPRVMGPIVALAAAVIAVVWGPRTLTRSGSSHRLA